ncbi:MAG: hypothetical protein AAGH65_06835 [Pseudomonadota bacterium]
MILPLLAMSADVSSADVLVFTDREPGFTQAANPISGSPQSINFGAAVD